MQKRVTMIVIAVMTLLLVGVITAVIIMTNSSFNEKNSKNATDIQTAQAKLDAIKASKDKNGFTPTDTVKAFFTEVKSDSVDNAKLYLAPEIQNMDTKATLKLGTDLANVTTGDSFEDNSGDDKVVTMTFVLAEGDSAVRIFTLGKFDEAWKIIGVTVV